MQDIECRIQDPGYRLTPDQSIDHPPLPIYTFRCAFTFLEVVIALAIVSFMALAVGHALMTVLRAERIAVQVRESALLIDTIATRHYFDQPIPETMSVVPGGRWKTASEVVSGDTNEETESMWKTFTLTRGGPNRYPVRMAFYEGNGYEVPVAGDQ